LLTVDNTVDASSTTASATTDSNATTENTSTTETAEAKTSTEKSSESESTSTKQSEGKQSEGAKNADTPSSPSKSTATAKTATASTATTASAVKTNTTVGSPAKTATTAANPTAGPKSAATNNQVVAATNSAASSAATNAAASQTASASNSSASNALTSAAAAKTESAESSSTSSDTKTAASSQESSSTTTSQSASTSSVAKAPAVSVATAKATLSDNMTSVKAGANGVDTLKTSLAEAAIKTGVPVAQATKAGDSFAQVLVTKLASGMSMSAATAQAQNAFNSTVNAPVPSTPQAIAASSLSGSATASSLAALSGTTTSSGSAAFEASLSASLANGNSMEQAIKTAQSSAQQIEAAAKIDNSPRGGLVNGAAGALTDTSPAFQNSLSNALAKGMSPEQALQHATAFAAESAAAAKADASSPKTALSSGNDGFAKTIPAGDFSKTLSSALNRGISMAQAMKNAAQSEAEKQRGIEIDTKSPSAGFSNGKTPEMPNSLEFDIVMKSAMARGLTPEKAINIATQTVTNLPKDVDTLTNSFATGKNPTASIDSHSQAYKTVLNAALGNGMSPDSAIAKAERAEATSKSPSN